MKKPLINVIQPESIFKILNIKDESDAHKILSVSHSFLLYLKKGDSLRTATATFHKIDHDLIQIESNLNPEYITDELIGKRIIKFPL